MAKSGRQNGLLKSLHIKKGTSGTSNEVSLSVLDKLKEQDNPTESSITTEKIGGVWLQTNGKNVGGGKSGKAKSKAKNQAGMKQDTLHLASDLPSGEKKEESRKKQKRRERALANPDAEIARRKRNRRIRSSVIVVLTLTVLGVGAYTGSEYVIQQYQTQQDGMSLLERGFEELDAADNLVLPMDGLVTGEIDEASLEKIEEVEAGISNAEVHISAAETFAQDASTTVTTDAEKAVAQRLGDSAQARRQMMEQALVIMGAERDALAAISAMEECWELLLQADDLIREAAELVTDTTVENVELSQEKTEQAVELLTQAQGVLAEAQAAYPSADLEMFAPYIEKRIEGCGYAIASDEAIYLQDKATAESNNELFNQCEAEAATLAAELPENPVDPVLEALDNDTQEARDLYLSARTSAAQSDAYIREYLGQSEL